MFLSHFWSHGTICYYWFGRSPCKDMVNGNCILPIQLPWTWSELTLWFILLHPQHFSFQEAKFNYFIVIMKGDITDLAVSSNSALVASSSNDFVIRVVRYLSISYLIIYIYILCSEYVLPLCCFDSLMFLLDFIQWRLPDGLPISVLRGHTGTVTAIAFSPRLSAVYQLLS